MATYVAVSGGTKGDEETPDKRVSQQDDEEEEKIHNSMENGVNKIKVTSNKSDPHNNKSPDKNEGMLTKKREVNVIEVKRIDGQKSPDGTSVPYKIQTKDVSKKDPTKVSQVKVGNPFDPKDKDSSEDGNFDDQYINDDPEARDINLVDIGKAAPKEEEAMVPVIDVQELVRQKEAKRQWAAWAKVKGPKRPAQKPSVPENNKYTGTILSDIPPENPNTKDDINRNVLDRNKENLARNDIGVKNSHEEPIKRSQEPLVSNDDSDPYLKESRGTQANIPNPRNRETQNNQPINGYNTRSNPPEVERNFADNQRGRLKDSSTQTTTDVSTQTYPHPEVDDDTERIEEEVAQLYQELRALGKSQKKEEKKRRDKEKKEAKKEKERREKEKREREEKMAKEREKREKERREKKEMIRAEKERKRIEKEEKERAEREREEKELEEKEQKKREKARKREEARLAKRKEEAEKERKEERKKLERTQSIKSNRSNRSIPEVLKPRSELRKQIEPDNLSLDEDDAESDAESEKSGGSFSCKKKKEPEYTPNPPPILNSVRDSDSSANEESDEDEDIAREKAARKRDMRRLSRLDQVKKPALFPTEVQDEKPVPALTNLRERPQLLGVFSIKTYSSHPRSKCRPAGLAISPSGNYIITDHADKTVKVFNKSGQVKVEFGGGNIVKPWGVCLLKDGNVAVTDPGDSAVKMFTRKGRFIKNFEFANLVEPYGITVSNAGDILVTDKGANDLYVFDTNGHLKGSLGNSNNNNNNSIAEWPQYVAVDSTDNIIISDYMEHAVKIFSPSGTLIKEHGSMGVGTGQLMCPQGVCVDTYGHIIVADNINSRVKILSPNGEFIKELVTRKEGIEGPEAVAIDHDGNLVMTEGNTGNVKIFSYVM